MWSSDEEGDSDDETIQKKKSSKQVGVGCLGAASIPAQNLYIQTLFAE